MNIKCAASAACAFATIDGRDAAKLRMEDCASGWYTCYAITVWCPQNVNGDKKCIIQGQLDFNPSIYLSIYRPHLNKLFYDKQNWMTTMQHINIKQAMIPWEVVSIAVIILEQCNYTLSIHGEILNSRLQTRIVAILVPCIVRHPYYLGIRRILALSQKIQVLMEMLDSNVLILIISAKIHQQ